MKKKKLGLSTKIFISLFLGAFAGILLYYVVPAGFFRDDLLIDGIFYAVGQGFIRLMQMLVVPLVFCSLVGGSMAIGDTKMLGKVGVKTLLFYLTTTAIAVVSALFIATIFSPGIGLNMEMVEMGEVGNIATDTNVVETLLNIIPKNPIASLASGDMLPIILFAVFIGLMIAKLGDRAATVTRFFSEFNDIMMQMTSSIMIVAPYGVFCLISRTFATLGFEAFVPMLKYLVCIFIALAIQCLGTYQILLFVFTKLNPIKFIKKYLPVMGFAFSTSTSNATIPLAIETLEKKIGVSKKISAFTIPLGATINMDGTSIMQGVATIFIAQAFGIALTIPQLATVVLTATLASIGTAGAPGVGLITLSMVLSSVGLPLEGIAIIMGIDRIVDMLRTVVNITGDAVCTIVIASQEKLLDKDIYNKD